MGAKEGFGQTVNDFWIETKISARLLTEPEVRSVNYRWRSVRNTVYIIGRARSEAELQRLLEICKSVDGVVAVKPFVEIRPPTWPDGWSQDRVSGPVSNSPARGVFIIESCLHGLP